MHESPIQIDEKPATKANDRLIYQEIRIFVVTFIILSMMTDRQSPNAPEALVENDMRQSASNANPRKKCRRYARHRTEKAA